MSELLPMPGGAEGSEHSVHDENSKGGIDDDQIKDQPSDQNGHATADVGSGAKQDSDERL
jgi:hypothetical protein